VRKLCLAESGSNAEVLSILLRLGAVRDEQAVAGYTTLLGVPRLSPDDALLASPARVIGRIAGRGRRSAGRLLLGGLIKQDNSDTSTAVRYLGRLPGLKWLFGSTTESKARTELIVLITPRVATGNSQVQQVTEDYRQQMQLLKP
jgi:hypothetical protein